MTATQELIERGLSAPVQPNGDYLEDARELLRAAKVVSTSAEYTMFLRAIIAEAKDELNRPH